MKRYQETVFVSGCLFDFIEVSARRTPSKGRDRSVLPQAKPKG
ncbi:hypothetical protein QNJ39_10345 [Macrococcus caseolyticus]|nr:hypothetical protein [Macrococcus caseolyticus]MDJ1091992.1 hypothetical protein [Macrococcus caseolyticus]MDJ1154393.1 hypothetical protein [Macrococcus caseolyticus]